MVRAPRLSNKLLDANSKPKDHKSEKCIRPLMQQVERAIYRRARNFCSEWNEAYFCKRTYTRAMYLRWFYVALAKF